MPIESAAPLSAGESILFIDEKDREYLHPLVAGRRIQLGVGTIACDDLIGKPDARRLTNTAGQTYLAVRPTYAQLIPNLPRKAQVIYPKDIGPILVWGDIYPGATVIEVGVGPGSLTMALLRAVGPNGKVISYEIRADHVEMARRNVERFSAHSANWTPKVRDAFAGFDETDVDRMTVDLPEPWHVVEPAARALRPGGVILMYVPTVLQVKNCVDALRAHGAFDLYQTFETLHRPWHVLGRSVRPDHRMVAHTGFIIVARRFFDVATSGMNVDDDNETIGSDEE